ncbi:type II secretion system minor pseudopilin GspK [Sansalvadorimonas sp. 2012CJ34-2]|uniref:Type II secretion system protein K n=1 Tax=Parendozoicomonas callyspongiae TaxID=2942213 RepID=A0ABT0PKA7_9GAMM|nr:type II secretion system minor pseudopilin GspK [Sansalvadorimonas sp. 2012CJ34-2]MCL6271147.1 type II secretion system minor pseudopilin GspK [Sansalvadorimonas sp. 2012CJ34-2]
MMNRTPCMVSHQRGVALIFVMVIFALVTVMASRIITNLHLNTEKNARHLQYLQARHYALGAENYIAALLEEDAVKDKQENRQIDHWNEPWAADELNLETEDGDITILTLDDQGRFNLNLLAGKDNKEKLKMLERLLVAHNIDARLAYRIRDWVDENQDALPGGAEDNNYLLLTPPYRTGDTLLASVSELRLMEILSLDDFNKLVPLVSVLPDETAGINMNTVSAGVLRALNERISEADAKGFVNSRPKDGYAELKEVKDLPLLKNKLSKQVEGFLALKSSYYSVYTRARYRDITYYLHSRLVRNAEGKVTVISREVGVFPRWVQELRESVR